MVDLDRRIEREKVFGIVPRRNRKLFRSSGVSGNERYVFNRINIYN